MTLRTFVNRFVIGEKAFVTMATLTLSFILAILGLLSAEWTVIATAGIAAYNAANVMNTRAAERAGVLEPPGNSDA